MKNIQKIALFLSFAGIHICTYTSADSQKIQKQVSKIIAQSQCIQESPTETLKSLNKTIIQRHLLVAADPDQIYEWIDLQKSLLELSACTHTSDDVKKTQSVSKFSQEQSEFLQKKAEFKHEESNQIVKWIDMHPWLNIYLLSKLRQDLKPLFLQPMLCPHLCPKLPMIYYKNYSLRQNTKYTS